MPAEAELSLSKYLKKSSDMYFGLTVKQVRGLAYDFAKKLKLPVPVSWEICQMAGVDWASNFLKRFPELSVRKPRATSLARATAFNRVNVAAFFEKLKFLMNKYNFSPQKIYNMDEFTTVASSPD